MTISCGVAFFPQDAEDFETLHANVEYALEQAKKVGRGSIAQFSRTNAQKKSVEKIPDCRKCSVSLLPIIAEGLRWYTSLW